MSFKNIQNNKITVHNTKVPYKDDLSRYSTFKVFNITVNVVIFIGLNPFIVIYAQRLPYVKL